MIEWYQFEIERYYDYVEGVNINPTFSVEV